MKNIDQMLYDAYAYRVEPSDELNQSVMDKAMEEKAMRRFQKKKMIVLAATVAVMVAGTTAAYGAWKLLSPSDMAAGIQDESLASAFSSSNAVEINETQSCNGYDVTLLGMVSGSQLSDYWVKEDNDDRTYVAVAIKHSDGQAMEESDEFFMSTYIEGYNPVDYNITTMSKNIVRSNIIGGVEYSIVDVNYVECFADNNIYFGVSNGVFYNPMAYLYDNTMARNIDYKGVNALFTLNIDKTKADAFKAKSILDEMEANKNKAKEAAEEQVPSLQEGLKRLDEKLSDEKLSDRERTYFKRERLFVVWMLGLNTDNIDQKAKLLEECTQTIVPDHQGRYSCTYNIGADSFRVEGDVYHSFAEMKFGMSPNFGYSYDIYSDDGFYIDTLTMNNDGTITLKVYLYKPVDWNKIEEFR